MTVLKSFFAEKLQEVEQVIQQVASILSALTNYTSIVLGPELFNTTLKHLQVVPLNEQSAVAIIVTSSGHVENKLFTIPPGVPISEIEKFVAILNAKLANAPLLHLKSKLYNEISDELRRYVVGYEDLVKVFENVVHDDSESRIFLSGATNMLTQPEFKDVDKVKSILDLLDETPTLVKMIASAPEGIQVRIGTENSVAAINNCSLITATYSLNGKNVGTVGILGPTRMEYAKVINLLNHLTKDLAFHLERWYK